MNPFPINGQNYKQRLAFFVFDPTGSVVLTDYDPMLKIAMMNYGSYSRKVWMMPDGSASLFSNKQCDRYSLSMGKFVPDVKGRQRIIGNYPIFKLPKGDRVWLDYDRSISLTPVDFVERCNEHFRDTKRRLNQKAKK